MIPTPLEANQPRRGMDPSHEARLLLSDPPGDGAAYVARRVIEAVATLGLPHLALPLAVASVAATPRHAAQPRDAMAAGGSLPQPR